LNRNCLASGVTAHLLEGQPKVDRVIAILTELVLLQRSQSAIGKELIHVLSQEEEAAASGFTVAQLFEIVAAKDQIIHRFKSAETKRRQLASSLAFLIGLDTRNLSPTLSLLRTSLMVYSNNLARVMSGEALERVQKAIGIYCAETETQIGEFSHIADAVSRNRTIVTRLRDHVNRSVRFFEQAFRLVDLSYDKGGKMTHDKSRARRNAQVAVKA